MRYPDFVAGLRDAYEHAGGIKTLRLGALDPEWFAQIQREAATIIETGASSDVGAAAHVTHWPRPQGTVQQFSLFNVSGRSEDYHGDYGHRGDVTQKRRVFPHLPGITRFAALFGRSLRNARLDGMGTAASLSAHEENSIEPQARGTTYFARFHLPVFTSNKAFVYLDDERYQYKEGNLYFFHHGCVNAAANFSELPRYHLVLDCVLDRTLFANLFPGTPCPDQGFIKAAEHDCAVPSDPYIFADFVCESGRIITTGIRYGRKAPTVLDYYRKNYPRVFSLFGKKSAVLDEAPAQV